MKKLLLIALVLIGLTSFAQEQKNHYIGLNLGYSTINEESGYNGGLHTSLNFDYFFSKSVGFGLTYHSNYLATNIDRVENSFYTQFDYIDWISISENTKPNVSYLGMNLSLRTKSIKYPTIVRIGASYIISKTADYDMDIYFTDGTNLSFDVDQYTGNGIAAQFGLSQMIAINEKLMFTITGSLSAGKAKYSIEGESAEEDITIISISPGLVYRW